MCRPTVGRSSLDSKVIGRRSADDRPIVQFYDFLSKSVRIVFNVIASVGRQIDVDRAIKIQKSYRPTVFFNVIAAKLSSLHSNAQFAPECSKFDPPRNFKEVQIFKTPFTRQSTPPHPPMQISTQHPGRNLVQLCTRCKLCI